MINIAICDDDIVATGKLDCMLQNIAKKYFVDLEIEVYWDGEGLIKSVESKVYYDMIFLDIEMKNENGISVARKIRKIDNNVLIIYVTSYESYMLESFSVRPFRFIIKPLNEQELHNCFKAAFDDISNSDSYFRYNYQRIRHKIPIRDILYFQSNRRKIKIVTQENVFEFYGKLNDIETSLINSKAVFLRVHQSFLVNYKHVKGLSYDFLVLDNGKYIPISEDRRKQISEQYCAMEDVFYVNI